MNLNGKTLLLGITGGIAAYKSAELVRLLTKAGATVHVAMTEAGMQFMTPTTMQALSGNPVHTTTWDTRMNNGMAHIDLSRHCDAVLIAPCSADFMAKLAHGMADDLLSTLCLARDCPLWIAPAMNKQMWNNPATQRNLQTLINDGVLVFGPAEGEQACGEVGYGRMLEAQELFESVIQAFTPQVLKGKHVLMTAGPTYEPIDPVRGITNRSSGKMGYAIAQAAARAGAHVTLISGPTALSQPFGVQRIQIQTAQDMLDAVMNHISHADVFIGVAAVADWKVKAVSDQKRKKSDGGLQNLVFEENPDILATVAHLANHQSPQKPLCVGFAAETQSLETYGRKKLTEKQVSLVVGNLAQDTLGSDEVEFMFIDTERTLSLPKLNKSEAAHQLIHHIASRLQAISPI